ncbi:MAG: hypothetical protein IKM20_00115 [Erysipelotrichales bacterium]|nr:hypothetical protein [Erysipelotrichales bacterium]
MLNPELNAEQGWLASDAKYFPSEKTAMYYLGLGGGKITGGRFLAPGAEEREEVWTNQFEHKDYADEFAVFEKLVQNGAMFPIYDEDGELERIVLRSKEYFFDKANAEKAMDLSYVMSIGTGRRADEEMILAAVNYYVTGTEIPTSTAYTVAYVANPTYTAEQNFPLYQTVDANGTQIDDLEDYYNSNGYIIKVEEKKSGYILKGVEPYAAPTTKTATGSDIAFSALEDDKTYYIDGDWSGLIKMTTDTIVPVKADTRTVYNRRSQKTYAEGTSYDAIEIAMVSASGYVTTKIVVTAEDEVITKYDATKAKFVVVEDLSELSGADLSNYYYNGTKLNTTGFTVTSLDKVDYDGYVYNNDTDTWVGYWNEKKANSTGYVLAGYESDYFPTSATRNFKTSYSTIENTLTAAQKLGKYGKIVVVDVSDEDYYRLNTVDYAVAGQFDYKGTYNFNLDTLEFDFVKTTVAGTTANGTATTAGLNTTWLTGSTAAGVDNEVFAAYDNAYGFYYIDEIPENDSEYYVIANGVAGLDIEYSVNGSKEIPYVTLADCEVLETKAVELDRVWYPAFETEEELTEAVAKIAGVDALEGTSKELTSDFGIWYAAASPALKDVYSGFYNGEALPLSAEANLHNGTECDYTMSSSSDKVTVEATNTVDTTVAGVYDLEYSATYEGEVVGTTSIKVVVAPNYTRTWENGRVKTLTSYYVSHPTAKYAEYNYNWAAGTVTVTYYNVDGSVNETATNNL